MSKDDFPYEDYKRHLRNGGAPFGKFNATINEAIEGYQDIIDEQKKEYDRVIKYHQIARGDCVCSQNEDGTWNTPPSCPFHGIKHLRDTNDHRIRRFSKENPQTIFDELDAVNERMEAFRSTAPIDGQKRREAEEECDRLRGALKEAADDLGKAANQFASIRESQKAGHFPIIEENPEIFEDKEKKARKAIWGND